MVRGGAPSETSSRRPAVLAGPAVTVLLAVAAVVLIALVATGDRVPLATEGSGGWHLEPRRLTDDRAQPFEPATPAELPADARLPGEGALAVLAQTALILLGLTVLYFTWKMLLRASRRVPDPPDLLPEEHWPEPAVEMVEAVDDGLAALAGGPVDEVIVACWVRLEDAAAAAGVGRTAAETSAELASRVLADLHAPEDAVDVLLRRYRQARYSHHPLDEADRAAAVRALEDIRRAIAGVHA